MFNLYISIIFFCLIVSLINKTAKQKLLSTYFLIVLVSELLVHFDYVDRKLYDYTNTFYMVFFSWYFLKVILNRIQLVFITILILVINILISFERQNLAIFQTILYVLLTIHYFYQQIANTDFTAIYKKMDFWVSASLLLWSCMYIMRILPAYFFAVEDQEFLEGVISRIYQSVVVICYFLFSRGLLCKRS